MKVSHVSSLPTDLTCNCLLSARSTAHLYAACYAHTKASTEEDHDTYSGTLTDYGVGNAPTLDEGRTCAMQDQPGIFDISWWDSPPCGTSSAAPSLLCCCTDGSARLVDPAGLAVTRTFAGIHGEMLTSATPYTTEGEFLLCTAHTGAALVYDVAQERVKDELEGHEFDAWCSAASTQLLTGGDDGLLKFYDIRASTSATAKMRFSAGVVSVAPVAEGGQTGSLVLVGSYDESLSLVDLRHTRRPVAAAEQMGGGVWRCRSTLQSPTSRFGTVCENGTLVLPLMQRGAAAIAYDVRQPEANVFGDPFYFYQDAEATEQETSLLPLSENCLVYDVAVLQFEKNCEAKNEEERDCAVATVATCSFYEKKIDLWRLYVE